MKRSSFKPKIKTAIRGLSRSQRWQQKIDLFFDRFEENRKKLGVRVDKLLTVLAGASVIILVLTVVYVVFINEKDRINWLYQLQNIDIDKLISSPFEIVVIDYSKDGTENERLSKVDIARVKASGKKTLAYLSIGNAENYRFYWKEEWNIQKPSFIGDESSAGKGSYVVKYWHEEWKNILYKGDSNFLDKILEAEFDGVYLDGVDAFEYWVEKSEQSSAFEGIDPREEMINLILAISKRVKQYDQNMKVFIQNALSLTDDQRVFDAIDGIGKEELIFIDGKKRPDNEIADDTSRLDRLIQAKKTVLIAEYISDKNQIKDICYFTLKHNFIPFIGEKELKTTPLEKICK